VVGSKPYLPPLNVTLRQNRVASLELLLTKRSASGGTTLNLVLDILPEASRVRGRNEEG